MSCVEILLRHRAEYPFQKRILCTMSQKCPLEDETSIQEWVP